MSNQGRALRTVYALCLMGATVTHLRVVLAHGLAWDYGGLPIVTCVYWTSLTFLDPLAASLLFLAPRAGIFLTIAIMVTDVSNNTWIGLRERYSFADWMYLSQVFFLIFVLTTSRYAWPGRRDHPQA